MRRLAVPILGLLLAVTSGTLHSTVAAQRTSRRVALAAGTTVRVEATVGDVTIRGSDRDDLSVVIECQASSDPGLSPIEPVITTNASGVAISVVQRDGGRSPLMRGSVTIDAPSHQSFGDITLFEGRLHVSNLLGGIRARVERGEIQADGVDGPIRLETVVGAIRVRLAAPVLHSALRLRTFNGPIALRLAQPPPNARLMALSLGGTVSSDVPLSLRTGFGPTFGETTLGEGEPVIALDAVNGDISIETGRR